MKKPKYKNWTLIDWDGNHALGYKCWRKSFRHGHISVGVGEFISIVHSFGANSDDSFSGMRQTQSGEVLTEEDAMSLIDSQQKRR